MVMIVTPPAPAVVISRERRTVDRARGNLRNRSGVREAGAQTERGPPEGARDSSRAGEFLQHATTPFCVSTPMSPTSNHPYRGSVTDAGPEMRGTAQRMP
jgi:hypothetical protein